MALEDGGVWFPAVRVGTGVGKFTECLVDGLTRRGIRAEIEWLPRRAEFLPWTVKIPSRPDWASVVHINSWIHRRFIPEDLPCLVTLHSCVHDPAFEPYKSRAQSIYHKFWVYQLELASMERAQVITAVSDYTSRAAKAAFPQLGDVRTIHNWVDTSVFAPVKRGVANRPFRLLFVGNVSARKGRDLLVQIMAGLASNYELSYTGVPEDFPKGTSLPENMISLGLINGAESMARLYQSHDALLFPSRLEGLPLSVLEASSSGLPVITSKASSMPEVVRHGKTGFLCETNSVTAYIHAVEALAGAPEAWLEMRKNARDWVESEFSMESALDRYIEMYQAMLK